MNLQYYNMEDTPSPYYFNMDDPIPMQVPPPPVTGRKRKIKQEPEMHNMMMMQDANQFLMDQPPPAEAPAPAKKKRGRKPKDPNAPKKEKASKADKQGKITDTMKPKKKIDRFNGMSEEDVAKKTLPDHIRENLDVLIIGINPGLMAAHIGHYYAGPGNHFWQCLYLSGLIQEPMTCYDDKGLMDFGIGLTSIVSRTTRGSADLSRKEIKAGAEILIEKIKHFKPKVAAFNGKGIYEIFCGNKNFAFGKQPDKIGDTVVYVMPSSSARCAQLPKAQDKVPFYLALKKLRDHLRGDLPHLDDSEVSFPDLELKVIKKEERLAMEAEARKVAMAEIGLDETGTMPLANSQAMSLQNLGFNQSGDPMQVVQMTRGCDDIFAPYAQMNHKHGRQNAESHGVQVKQEMNMDNQNYGQMPQTFQMPPHGGEGNMGYNPLQQMSQGIVQIDGFSNNSEQGQGISQIDGFSNSGEAQNGQSTNHVHSPAARQSMTPQNAAGQVDSRENGESSNRPSSAAGSESQQHESNKSVPQSPSQAFVQSPAGGDKRPEMGSSPACSPAAVGSPQTTSIGNSPSARSPAGGSPRGFSQAVVPVNSQGSPQGHAFSPVSHSSSQLHPPPPQYSESHQTHYLPNQQGYMAHSHARFSHPQAQLAQSQMQFAQPGQRGQMMSVAQSFQFPPHQGPPGQFLGYAQGQSQFSQLQMMQQAAQGQISQMSFSQGNSHFAASQGPYFQFNSSSSMSMSISSSSSSSSRGGQDMLPSPGNHLQMLNMPGVGGGFQVKSEPGTESGVGGGGCQYSQL